MLTLLKQLLNVDVFLTNELEIGGGLLGLEQLVVLRAYWSLLWAYPIWWEVGVGLLHCGLRHSLLLGCLGAASKEVSGSCELLYFLILGTWWRKEVLLTPSLHVVDIRLLKRNKPTSRWAVYLPSKLSPWASWFTPGCSVTRISGLSLEEVLGLTTLQLLSGFPVFALHALSLPILNSLCHRWPVNISITPILMFAYVSLLWTAPISWLLCRSCITSTQQINLSWSILSWVMGILAWIVICRILSLNFGSFLWFHGLGLVVLRSCLLIPIWIILRDLRRMCNIKFICLFER